MPPSVNTQKPLINLLRGWPNPSLLPAAQLATASQAALTTPSISTPALLYGDNGGYEPLRVQIGRWLTEFYSPSQPITSGRLCVTGGASQNLACALQVFSDPLYTRNVWMVAPTYFLACRIFEDNGFAGKLRAVPEDSEGVDISFLEREIRKSEERAVAQGNTEPILKPSRPWSKIYKHLIYAVPTFSNPSSATMSLPRRQELVRIAREYDALILTDDVYDMLQWPASIQTTHSTLDKAILPRIVDVDRSLEGGSERRGADGWGNAMSNGSFSKIVGPGVRTGWAEGTEKLVTGLSQTGSTCSGGAPSQLTASFITSLLSSSTLQTRILQTLQPSYARRYRSMLDAITTHLLPLGVTLTQPSREVVGGYFIWFTLPPDLKADEVVTRAKSDENLIISPGSAFEVVGDTGQKFEREIRVCFAWEEEENLVEGIKRLARALEGSLRNNGGT